MLEAYETTGGYEEQNIEGIDLDRDKIEEMCTQTVQQRLDELVRYNPNFSRMHI